MLTRFEFILCAYLIFDARELVVSSSLIGSDISEMSKHSAYLYSLA